MTKAPTHHDLKRDPRDTERLHRSHALRWALVLLVLVALGVMAVRVANRFLGHMNAAEHFTSLGGSVEWAWKGDSWRQGGYTTVNLSRAGQKGFVSDIDLAMLAKLDRVEQLNLSQCGLVTDDGLKLLASLKDLEELFMDSEESPGPRVTEAGLEHLKPLSHLKSLSLAGSNLTDAGLARLESIKSLESLDLEGTRVSDAGLSHLKNLPRLKVVLLGRTLVSARGARDLRRARPMLEVHHETFDEASEESADGK